MPKTGGGSGERRERRAHQDLPGPSNYALWLLQGNTGTVNDYLATLVGPQGPIGPVGPAGASGGGGGGTSGYRPYEYDARDFVASSVLFPTDGSRGNIAAAWTAFVAAMGTVTRPRVMYIPAGEFTAPATFTQSNPYSMKGANRLGMRGESEKDTIIYSDAGSAIIGGANTGSQLVDVEFSHMTLDCSAQTATTYTTSRKAIFIQDMLRPHIHHITFINSGATSLGCDALVDYRLESLTFYQPGRHIREKGLDPFQTSGGSAIGIGTGKYVYEPGVINDIIVHNAGRVAIFYEKQSTYSYYSRGHVARNIVSQGSWAGLQDCGADGLDIELTATDGVYGAMFAETILSAKAGSNARVNLKADRNTGADVYLGNCPDGKITIDLDSRSGTCGVISKSGATIGPRITIDMKSNDSKTSGGVNIQPAANVVDSLTLTGRVRRCGTDAIKIAPSTNRLTVNAQMTDASGAALRLTDATQTVTAADIRGDVRGSAATYVQQQVGTPDRIDLLGYTPAP